MAKRKRLTPARHINPAQKSEPARAPLGAIRPPIADVAQDAATSAAFDEVSRTLRDARESGRLIQALPLDVVDETYLVRDRVPAGLNADDMAVLIASLKARGQQTAIEVTDLGDGRYGLISGWRRLRALRDIHAEDASIDTVLAIVRTPEDMADAYQAMVDENEIRAGLSFYERARIVVKARESGVFNSTKGALGRLFGSVSRSKRSKINSFVAIVDAFDPHLRFPTALSERVGLIMARTLESVPDFKPALITALTTQPIDCADDELTTIMNVVADVQPGERPRPVSALALDPPVVEPPDPDPAPAPPAPSRPAPEIIEIRAGLRMTVHANGRVVLDGPRLTEPGAIKALQDTLYQL